MTDPQPQLDAAFLRALHILSSNSIGFHSLGIAYSRLDGWRLTATFANESDMQQAGAALGLDSAQASRGTVWRDGAVLGVPATCLWWTSKASLTNPAAVVPASTTDADTLPSRGYVAAAAATADEDLLALISASE